MKTDPMNIYYSPWKICLKLHSDRLSYYYVDYYETAFAIIIFISKIYNLNL